MIVDVVAFHAAHAAELVGLGKPGRLSSSDLERLRRTGRRRPVARRGGGRRRLPAPAGADRGDAENRGSWRGNLSTRKVALERALLEQDSIPATAVRPGAVDGPGAGVPARALLRQVWLLDGCRLYRSPTAAKASSIRPQSRTSRSSSALPWSRRRHPCRNCGDPEPLAYSSLPRDHPVARARPGRTLDHRPERRRDHPWAVPRPFVRDMRSAEAELGYRPVATYERRFPRWWSGWSSR